MPKTAAADLAEAYFFEHYNCCQSTLWGIAEACGLACPRCIPAIALAMGGGVGHTGRVCGAVTGTAMALGLAVDAAMADRPIGDRKDRANEVAGAFVHRFEAQFGPASCTAILGFSWEDTGALDRYYAENAKTEKCLPRIRWAATEGARLIAAIRGS